MPQKNTYVDVVYQEAKNCQAIGVELPPFGKSYHDVNTSFGDGLNVVAPSLGIILEPESNFIYEFRGTSYAAPIITGVLACQLSEDKAYMELQGFERADYASKILRKICIDLKIKNGRTGYGMPKLSC